MTSALYNGLGYLSVIREIIIRDQYLTLNFFLLFQNFLIRKGFKNNLKRTKSAAKLDRKHAAPQAVDGDG